MAVQSFIFGGDTPYKTPQELARARAFAQALAGNQRAPKNVGEGLNSIGQAILYRALMGKADKSEAALEAGRQKAVSPIIDALNAQTVPFPSAPPEPGNEASASYNTGADAPAVSITGGREGFVSALMPAALEASQRTGVDPRIIVAQAAQETGWGKHAPGNNFFGIKSHGQSGGNTLATTEYVNGKPVRTRDSFRGYASPEDSVKGYADFLLKNPRYKPMMAAQGLDAQLEALQASGYATDPNYSRSVGAIAKALNLPDASQKPLAFQQIPPELGQEDVEAFRNRPRPVDASPYSGPGSIARPEDIERAAAEERARDRAALEANSPAWLNDTIRQANPGQQVASLDQSVGMPVPPVPMPAQPPQFAGQPTGVPQTMPYPAQAFAQAPMGAGNGMMPPMGGGGPNAAPALPDPRTVQDRPVAAPQPAPMPEMAGNNPTIPNGPSLGQLYQALQNPALTDNDRAMINGLIARQVKQNDPAAKLDLAYKQAQIDKLQREASGQGKFGNNVVWGQDADGNWVALQPSSGGGLVQATTPDGVRLSPPGVGQINLGTSYGIRDRNGNLINNVPIDNAGKAADTEAGKAQGEALASYNSMLSKLPGLETVVTQLDDIANKATYTLSGQGRDWLARQAGMTTEGALARTQYQAMVANQILPLLRDTFGAQFTAREGDTLMATMGDPDKSPSEKQAVLKAFIEQKRRDVEALARQTGQQPPVSAPPPASKVRRYNPATGELE